MKGKALISKGEGPDRERVKGEIPIPGQAREILDQPANDAGEDPDQLMWTALTGEIPDPACFE
jgi:hypothetical protein